MQDKEKFILPNLDETQTGRDTLGSSWKEQQDTQAGPGSIPQEKPAARAVPEQGCHCTEVPGVITSEPQL